MTRGGQRKNVCLKSSREQNCAYYFCAINWDHETAGKIENKGIMSKNKFLARKKNDFTVLFFSLFDKFIKIIH